MIYSLKINDVVIFLRGRKGIKLKALIKQNNPFDMQNTLIFEYI